MNRISGFEHRELVLLDGEPSLRHRSVFIESAPLGAEIAVDVPRKLISAVEALVSAILRVAELSEFRERLNLLTEYIRQLV